MQIENNCGKLLEIFGKNEALENAIYGIEKLTAIKEIQFKKKVSPSKSNR